VGDRAMLKNRAKVQQPYLKIMLRLQFVGIPIFALVQNHLSRKPGSDRKINCQLGLTLHQSTLSELNFIYFKFEIELLTIINYRLNFWAG
jgi:hypothetical protein